ncbi:MAG: hypothetical protein CSA62_06050 [Planctomycetota bacterium]|nr:MAG: hypothetical protein CSA62_06050 [Planctomycetota bacterium]
MLIECVRIRNLASLVGTQPPLLFTSGGLDSGLVAVVGPTGAGKSTILDAICLALFGKTPRLDRSGEDRSAGNILSRGTVDGYAELDFVDASGRRLRSRWEISRSRTHRLQTPKRFLFDRDSGETLATGSTEHEKAVEAAIGLSREQFVGVVLLAQGSFSTFISGASDDRARLLERLTGVEIYSKLGMAAFEWRRRAAAALKENEAKMGEHPLLGEEERAALEARHRAAKAQQLAAEQKAATCKSRYSELQALRQKSELLQQARDGLSQAQKNWAARAEQRAALEEAERLSGLAAPLDRVQQRRGAQRHAEDAKNRSDEMLEEARRVSRQAFDRFRSLLQSAMGLEARLEECVAELQRYSVADAGRLTQLRAEQKQRSKGAKQMAMLRQRIESSEADLLHAQKMVGESSTAEEDAAKEQQAESRLLEQCRLEHERHKQEGGDLEARISRVQELGKVIELITARSNAEQDLLRLSAECQEREKSLSQLQVELNKAEARYEERSRRARELHERLEKERLRQSLMVHRKELKPGDTCPLCEQQVHELPAVRLEGRILEIEDGLHKAKQEEKAAADERSSLEQAQKTLGEEDKKGAWEIKRLRDEQGKRSDRYAKLRLALPDLPAEIEELSEEELQDRLSRAEAAQKDFSDEAELLKRREESGDRAKDRWGSTQKLLADAKAQLRLVESKLEQDSLQLKGLEKDDAQATSQLEEGLEALAKDLSEHAPEFAGCSAWLDSLERKHRDYLQAERQLRDLRLPLREQREKAEAELPEGEGLEPDEWKGEQGDVLPLLNSLRGRFDEAKEALIGQQAKADSAAKQRKDAEEARKASEAELAAKLQELGLESEEQARRSMLSSADLARLRAELKDLEEQFQEARTQVATRESDLKQARQALSEEAPEAEQALAELLAEARQAQEAAVAAEKDAVSAVSEIWAAVQEDDNRRVALQELGEKRQRLQADFDRVDRLADLIGDSTGKKFRSLAQRLSLDSLLWFANRRLAAFAPRYQLERRGEGLELDIIDRELAEERRPVRTLSGGESFLVSLALAIALSDMKRGKSDLRSVFIDEGFGSLDQQSLELALSALEIVQNELGAQLFVISHVGDLQNRWDARIEVRRAGRGRSWLWFPGAPEQPPNDALPLAEPLFDLDPVVEQLKRRGPMTRNKIAELLGLEKGAALSRALKGDPRIALDGRSYYVPELEKGSSEEPDPL